MLEAEPGAVNGEEEEDQRGERGCGLYWEGLDSLQWVERIKERNLVDFLQNQQTLLLLLLPLVLLLLLLHTVSQGYMNKAPTIRIQQTTLIPQ